jgi:hypothetical protein
MDNGFGHRHRGLHGRAVLHLSPPTCIFIASSILMAHAQQFSIDLHLPGRPYEAPEAALSRKPDDVRIRKERSAAGRI